MEEYTPSARSLEREARHKAKYTEKNVGVVKAKGTAAKEAIGVKDAHPLSYHNALNQANDALEYVANDHPTEQTAGVFKHTEQARASLDAHQEAHTAGKTSEAAGYIRQAATHISAAGGELHKIAPLPERSTPEGKTVPGDKALSERVSNIASSYVTAEAGNKAARVTQPSAPDAGLLKKVFPEAPSEKKMKSTGEKLARQAVKHGKNLEKISPTVVRPTAEEQATVRTNALGLNRQMRAAGGSLSFLPETKYNKPAQSFAPAERTSAVQKYLGPLARYGKNSRVVVPTENSPEYHQHAETALMSLRKGRAIPQETKTALGHYGMSAVHKAHAEHIAGDLEAALPEHSSESGTGRGGSISDFESGRGA